MSANKLERRTLEGVYDGNTPFTNLLSRVDELSTVAEDGFMPDVIAFKVDFMNSIEKVKGELRKEQHLKILELLQLGYGQAEAGEEVGVSQQAVQQFVTKIRKLARGYYYNDNDLQFKFRG